jgi:hypothetical protein
MAKNKTFNGALDPNALPAYKKKSESMSAYAARNSLSDCSVKNCTKKRGGLGRFCSSHGRNQSVWGSPLGRVVRPNEILFERNIIKLLFAINKDHPAPKLAEEHIIQLAKLAGENKLEARPGVVVCLKNWWAYLVNDNIDVQAYFQLAISYLLAETRVHRPRLFYSREHARRMACGKLFRDWPKNETVFHNGKSRAQDHMSIRYTSEVIAGSLETFFVNMLAHGIELKRKVNADQRVFNSTMITELPDGFDPNNQ